MRQTLLGSEAVYALLEQAGNVVTAEAVRVPGLEPGTRVRLMARAVAGMERLDRRSEPDLALAYLAAA